MSRLHAHPGAMLRDELAERRLSANRLAESIGLSPERVCEIINEQSSVTHDTAVRLAHCLGISVKLWMTMQEKHDETNIGAKPKL